MPAVTVQHPAPELSRTESTDEERDGEENAAPEEPEEDQGSSLVALDRALTSLRSVEIELTHARLRTLAHLRLERFTKATKLCLRQNQLSSLLVAPSDAESTDAPARPLESLTALRDLDLYDNRLTSVDGLATLSELESFDVSFNLLRRIPADVLKTFSKLKTAYFIQNKISRIEGLEPLAATLTSIELGGNKLRRIENLDALTNLTELWLGKNKLTQLEGLDTLINLRLLSIQSNRIVKLEGLDKLTKLEELYISHNGVKELGGLEHNVNLRVLDVSNNALTRVANISHLSQLTEFWASNNQLAEFADIESQLAGLSQLETVYLEGNPLQRDLAAAYRRRVMLALPQVKQIDATFVRQS